MAGWWRPVVGGENRPRWLPWLLREIAILAEKVQPVLDSCERLRTLGVEKHTDGCPNQ